MKSLCKAIPAPELLVVSKSLSSLPHSSPCTFPTFFLIKVRSNVHLQSASQRSWTKTQESFWDPACHISQRLKRNCAGNRLAWAEKKIWVSVHGSCHAGYWGAKRSLDQSRLPWAQECIGGRALRSRDTCWELERVTCFLLRLRNSVCWLLYRGFSNLLCGEGEEYRYVIIEAYRK